MKKNRSRLIALLLALCLLVGAVPLIALADAGIGTMDDYQRATKRVQHALTAEDTPIEQEGQHTVTRTYQVGSIIAREIEDEAVAGGVNEFPLPAAGKLTLRVTEAAEAYRWQVYVGGVWANIAGETGNAVALTAGMLNNALTDGAANVRCVLTRNGEEQTITATVRLDETVKTATENVDKQIGVTTYYQETPIGRAKRLNRAQADANPTTYTVVINYVFADGEQAAPSWSATAAVGTSLEQDVQSPVVIGYTPDPSVVNVNANEAKTYTVTYQPAEVEFTVKHYTQNIPNDNYTLDVTETKTGFTKSAVGENLAKDSYTGFHALLYDTTTEIAADGSTVVEVYYDRDYYLMSFNLDGGFGVEPIYARYGAEIEVRNPIKPGYIFTGWTPSIPKTMPIGDTSYTAGWEIGTAGFAVVFWYENANDTNYSVAGTYAPENIQPGSVHKSGDYANYNFEGRDNTHFTYDAAQAETVTVKGDGSTVLNVYYKRNTYTLTFRELDCDKWFLHSHSDNCYKVVKTITAKWDASIIDEFRKEPFTTTYSGRAWKCTESNKFSYALQTLDRMPGFNATFNLYNKNSEVKKTIYYYKQKLATTVSNTSWPTSTENFDLYKQVDTYFTFATYNEEYHEMEGFTRYSARVAGFSNNKKDFVNNQMNLYYLRNTYKLRFYNYNDFIEDSEKSVQFEASLNGYGFTPNYPANMDQNAYVFAGWYTTAGCYEGTEANFATMTMPASDVVLYAKWASKTHTVKTYLTKDALDNGAEPLRTVSNIEHGTTIEKEQIPKNGSYSFVGWFYTSDTGEEKAYDFAVPVVRDLNLYAKWSSNVLTGYTVRYQLEDGTEIAPPTTGSALAGTTKTFDAKTGNALYEGYRSGYFPQTSSHSITINIDGNEENKLNEFIFVYVPVQEVEYTVRYLEKDTGNVLHDEKIVTTREAIVTEIFEPVDGYAPDAYQKRLVLAADNNVITFWYVKDEVHAPVKTIHWLQNIEGDGYTEYQSSTNLNGVIGNTYNVTPLENLSGFRYNGTDSTASGTLTAEGLVLNLYYDRIEYPYAFRFLEQGTDTELAASVTGHARYQAQVTQPALDIPGYTLVSAQNQAINIAIEDGNTAVKNVRVFEYIEKVIDIKYQVVGPNSCTLDNYQEMQVNVRTGTVKGSTPTAAENCKFIGWFTDAACTRPVNADWLDANRKLTPQQTLNMGTEAEPIMAFEEATYYAKFEYDVGDLKITKTGCEAIDADQSFLFTVSGNGVNMDVVIHGNGSVTIKGLKAGTYTVTENTDWSWRYQPVSNSRQSVNVAGGTAEVTFENQRMVVKWLDGNAYRDNKWSN